ncbi:signal transduction histidine kinase [Schinkia azotoformans MEV2011]|uniref:histidine kinase n=1 Tax=Schinkia azotoformans MEV2011 TaxID=1348973 RepID=A0A072NLW3_SCHAZ|nr:ATP-binding protein [Schinkia azotoformans]KEF37923.1 signal transduction histidine kinase [Schinkia azotoformans MEV2011]MEC1696282.1 ATP-binding protein [Schinkia azotoformans]MEC1717436.1 ATP-binding protein [Schinkia azotoformans]MEC1726787.1 ATP-binding protein [Schinkia azotoformans]MEC1740134.1 ATP-binding protein [Schinkia azotoformans]
MFDFIRDIAPNLFFILFLVFLYQYWSEKREWSKPIKQIAVFLFGALSIVLCMKFTIPTDNGLVFDLRYIPFIIGGLYGGPLVTIGLYLIMFILRLSIGGMVGITITTTIATLIAVLILSIYEKFTTWSSIEKISFATTLGTYSALTVAIMTVLISPGAGMDQKNWIAYIVAYLVGTWISTRVVEDIRQHELLQRKLIRNEKLEAVSHLASSISHEVRNPLTTSRGFMQLLSEQDVPVHCKEYIKISIEEIDRAAGIIQDYLTFAKPSPEKVEILQTKDELKRAMDVMQPLANMNNVEVQSVLMEGSIKAERSRLQQCLVNLMKNAIEAMPNGGLLSVYSNVIDDKTVVIRIRDTGIGMDANQLSRLGEPYFSTKEIKGTGLGMMVVYRIIESMNGFIEVESEVGKGTCFTITLPMKKRAKEKISLQREVV